MLVTLFLLSAIFVAVVNGDCLVNGFNGAQQDFPPSLNCPDDVTVGLDDGVCAGSYQSVDPYQPMPFVSTGINGDTWETQTVGATSTAWTGCYVGTSPGYFCATTSSENEPNTVTDLTVGGPPPLAAGIGFEADGTFSNPNGFTGVHYFKLDTIIDKIQFNNITISDIFVEGTCSGGITEMYCDQVQVPGFTPVVGGTFPTVTELFQLTENECAGLISQSLTEISIIFPIDFGTGGPVAEAECAFNIMGNMNLRPGHQAFSDNCGIPTLVKENTQGLPLGISTITHTVTDALNADTVCDYDITVIDNKAPVVACKDFYYVLADENDSVTVTFADLDDGTVDTCTALGSLTTSISPNTFDISDVGVNQVDLQVADSVGNSNGCNPKVIILPPVGGGGDPHLFAPFLPHGFELSQFVENDVKLRTRDLSDVVVELISTDTMTISGSMTKDSKNKPYFTSLSVSSGMETIKFGTSFTGKHTSNMDANTEITYNGKVTTCAFGKQSSTQDFFLANELSVTVQCNDVTEAAAKDSLIALKFPHHASNAVSRITLETSDMSVDIFYIQPERNMETGEWYAIPFGFFDFSLKQTSEIAGGILGFSRNSEHIRSVVEQPLSDFVHQFLSISN